MGKQSDTQRMGRWGSLRVIALEDGYLSNLVMYSVGTRNSISETVMV